MSADIAVVGLAVMGQNLILNMNDHGFVVSFKKNILLLIIFF
jgi:6-phosphogluconate dehydrogenase